MPLFKCHLINTDVFPAKNYWVEGIHAANEISAIFNLARAANVKMNKIVEVKPYTYLETKEYEETQRQQIMNRFQMITI